MEEILNAEEIQEINDIASSLTSGNIRKSFTNEQYKKIYRISTKTHLILINGNAETGLTHIWHRHWFWSTAIYLATSSKFPQDIAIIHFIDIADAIYLPENLDIENNISPEIWDIYTGNYCYKNGEQNTIRLVLYKDTKIIHSLFPILKKKKPLIPRPDKFEFRRANVEVNYFRRDKFVRITIPYVDLEFKWRYNIIFEKDYDKDTDTCFVELLEETRKIQIYIGEKKLAPCRHYRIEYQYCDLRPIERKISQIEIAYLNGEFVDKSDK
jgi:hypothetical protein